MCNNIDNNHNDNMNDTILKAIMTIIIIIHGNHGSLGKRSLGKNPYMCKKRICLFVTICLLFVSYLSLICLLFVSYLPLFVLITILLIFSYFPLIEGQCLSSSSLGVHSRKMLSTRIDVRNQH